MKKIIVLLVFVVLLMASCDNSSRAINGGNDEGTEQLDKETEGTLNEAETDSSGDETATSDDNSSDGTATVDTNTKDDDSTEINDDNPVCGNGIKEAGESCDDGNTTTETKDDVEYGKQIKSCNEDCTEEKIIVGPHCGDGEINGDEFCDGDAVACSEFEGYVSGVAECSSTCEEYNLDTCNTGDIVSAEGKIDHTQSLLTFPTTYVTVNGVKSESWGKGIHIPSKEGRNIEWYYGPKTTVIEDIVAYASYIARDNLTDILTVKVVGEGCIVGISRTGIVNIGEDIVTIKNVELRKVTAADADFIKEVQTWQKAYKICD